MCQPCSSLRVMNSFLGGGVSAPPIAITQLCPSPPQHVLLGVLYAYTPTRLTRNHMGYCQKYGTLSGISYITAPDI